jgi:hypothetical protein
VALSTTPLAPLAFTADPAHPGTGVLLGSPSASQVGDHRLVFMATNGIRPTPDRFSASSSLP